MSRAGRLVRHSVKLVAQSRLLKSLVVLRLLFLIPNWIIVYYKNSNNFLFGELSIVSLTTIHGNIIYLRNIVSDTSDNPSIL